MGEAHRSAEGWKAAVADFNRYAERLKKAGLGFAYHNHDFEFTMKPGGTSLFDTLIADADPAPAPIELDPFWAVAAGEDPKAILRRLVGVLHAHIVTDHPHDGQLTKGVKG